MIYLSRAPVAPPRLVLRLLGAARAIYKEISTSCIQSYTYPARPLPPPRLVLMYTMIYLPPNANPVTSKSRSYGVIGKILYICVYIIEWFDLY